MPKTDEKTIDDFINPKPKISNWSSFIEGDVANFFNLYQLEKITLEDGNGNKAKLSRQKDDGIKVEYSSITLL